MEHSDSAITKLGKHPVNMMLFTFRHPEKANLNTITND